MMVLVGRRNTQREKKETAGKMKTEKEDATKIQEMERGVWRVEEIELMIIGVIEIIKRGEERDSGNERDERRAR